MQAADRGTQVVTRAVIGGRQGRDEKPSFKVKSDVTAALLDPEQRHTFSTTQLLILSDIPTHEAKSVTSDLLVHYYGTISRSSITIFHVSLFLPLQASAVMMRLLPMSPYAFPMVGRAAS